MRKFSCFFIGLFLLTLSFNAQSGPFDDLKKGLEDLNTVQESVVSEIELTLPEYSPLGKRIANGEAVYSDTFYWINADGTIASTNRGWSRVPKPRRHLVYLDRNEAVKAVADASISPEERRAAERAAKEEREAAERAAKEERERIAAEKKAEEKRLAEQKKRELANAYSDYVYGTKDEPKLNRWGIQIKNEYIPDDKRLWMQLDFGPGLKAKAIRGTATCYDAFGDRAFSERFEDMNPAVFENKIMGYDTANIGNLRYSRPLDAVVNVVYFEPNMFMPAGQALASGGIEKCSFTLDKAVFK